MAPESAWPGLYLVGAPRAGTTALAAALAGAPGICLPLKEPHFFDSDLDRSSFFSGVIEDPEEYAALYRGCPSGSLRCDATPTYLVDPGAAGRIHAVAPRALILAIVRDPVARAVSHYHFRETRTRAAASLGMAAAIERAQQSPVEEYGVSYLLAPGFYATQITRYRERFGHDRVYTMVFEEFVADPAAELRRLAGWLGRDVPPPPRLKRAGRNALARPRGRLAATVVSSPAMRRVASKTVGSRRAVDWGRRILMRGSSAPAPTTEIVTRLEQIYRDDASRLQAMIGRTLPWPLLGGS